MNILANLITSFRSLLVIIGLWKTNLLGQTYLACKLFTTNLTPDGNTSISDVSEATFLGYSPISVTTINGPDLDQAGQPYLLTDVNFFQCTGPSSPNLIYLAGLVEPIAGAVQATITVHQTGGVIDSVTITAAGSGYLAPPHITVTGAPGVGAVLQAVITGGVLTAVNILSGGSGYVAPTAVVEVPVELVAINKLPTPIAMNKATDACPVALLLNLSNQA